MTAGQALLSLISGGMTIWPITGRKQLEIALRGFGLKNLQIRRRGGWPTKTTTAGWLHRPPPLSVAWPKNKRPETAQRNNRPEITSNAETLSLQSRDN